MSAASAEGHYRLAPDVEPELVYVAQRERAQQTLTLQEFATQYSWKNHPSAVKRTGK